MAKNYGHGRQHLPDLIKAQGGKCIWCDQRMLTNVHSSHPRRATLEHIKPRSFGGTSEWHNLAASCFKCNTTRGSQRVDPHSPPLAATNRAHMYGSIIRNATRAAIAKQEG